MEWLRDRVRLARYPRRRWIIAGLVGSAAIASGAYFYYWLYGDGDEDDEAFRFFGRNSGLNATSRELSSQQENDRNLQRHFESIQRISDGTTLPQMLIELEKGLDRAANVDLIIADLRQPSSVLKRSGATKIDIWNDLKLVSWARTLTVTWLVALLDLLLRVQLNILGRHLFFQQQASDSQRSELQSAGARSISERSQEMFLEYAHYLPERAIVALVIKMQDLVAENLSDLDLRSMLDSAEVQGRVQAIHEAFEDWAVQEGWASLALPTKSEAEEYFTEFQSSSGQTTSQDALDSDREVVQGMVDELHLVMSSTRFSATVLEARQEAAQQVEKHLEFGMAADKLPLAKVLPQVTAAGNSLLQPSTTGCHEWIERISNLPKVTELCASVYSCGPPPAFTSNVEQK